MALEGRRIRIRGTVQGVGFRPWVFRLAREQGLGGRVRNDAEGVTIEAFGQGGAIARFLQRLEATPPPASRVRDVRSQAIPHEPGEDFVIEASRGSGERLVSIPPDLATCKDCVREVFDPADRRHGYAFTNCTNCGPRFTLARDVPYDRQNTTMAGFRMCPACRREYEDPCDRRFHAQPDACPECGPRLRLVSPSGEDVPASDPLRAAAEHLREGLVVAVKGLGGFHLACDALSSAAVRRLRERKQRDEKPFAVMVPDLEAAGEAAYVDAAAAELLASIERPIVLLRRRPGCGLAPELAPGSSLVGLLLPYSPLHHLLLAEAGRPLVMTSGNLSEEPMVHQDEDAVARLGAIADVLLVHDRPIENRCDDSVARIVAGRPVVLRRARGYVPRGVLTARAFARPVLACGAHLKNTVCIGSGDAAYLGPHVGDLETVETCRAFEHAVERMQRFLGVCPEVVAYDLHPGYFSTGYALSRPEPMKVGVQHHHAHVASAMAEHRLQGPVIGVAYDGTGYGTDGAAWGGEVLLADFDGFTRLATFRPVRLAGSDQAIREVWRIALALVDDAFDHPATPPDLPLFRAVAERDLNVVRRMLEAGVHSPPAHGVGRYFDGIGALVLGRLVSRFEGQVALEWNLAAEPGERLSYPYEIADGALAQLDLRPMLRRIVDELGAGAAARTISARFHNTLVRATADLVRRTARQVGRLPVVLTGGCFQNPWLAEGVRGALAPEFDVRLHAEVPPGDGGIALGQAVVADAWARKQC